MADPSSVLCTLLVVAQIELQSLQAVYMQPTPVLSLGLSAEAWVSAPSPCMHHQMRVSSWGVQRGGQIVCAALSPFCLPQSGCCTLLWVSEAPCLSQLISQQRKGVPRVREPFSFTAPSQGHRSHPDSFSSPFFLPSYAVTFLAALIVWYLPPAFSRYSVRTVPHVDVFLMYFWEEVSSMSFYSAILISSLKLVSLSSFKIIWRP